MDEKKQFSKLYLEERRMLNALCSFEHGKLKEAFEELEKIRKERNNKWYEIRKERNNEWYKIREERNDKWYKNQEGSDKIDNERKILNELWKCERKILDELWHEVQRELNDYRKCEREHKLWSKKCVNNIIIFTISFAILSFAIIFFTFRTKNSENPCRCTCTCVCNCMCNDTITVHERIVMQGKDTVSITIEGKIGIDKEGNKIPFTIHVANGIRQWEKDSDSTLIGGSLNIRDYAKDIMEYEIFQKSHDLICIGLASEEESNLNGQETLSENRALRLVDAITVDREKGLYSLSYGQHIKTKNKTTDKQRSVIIFGVNKKGKTQEEIAQALEDILNMDYFKNSDYYYRHYSNYKDKNKSIELVPRRDK